MKRNQKKKTRLVAVILALVMLISVGYAALTSNLQINGNATIKAKNWNIYFDNVQVTTGSVTANPAPTTSGTSTRTLTWTVTMDTPGQFYEFYVDVVNSGDVDAMIGSLSNQTLTSAQSEFLTYAVTYDDGAVIEQYDELLAHSSDTLKVRLDYRTDIDPEDLPETAQEVTLTYTSTYVQADNNAKPRNTAGPTVQSQAQAGQIKVGDYVNYTPSSGSITVTPAQTGAEQNQTFSTANNSGMKWRVLSVDQTTGEVKIVSSPTTEMLTLAGKAGFENGVATLNSIASIYGGGVGAASEAGSVRSITEDDVFDAIGYDKAANCVGGTVSIKTGDVYEEIYSNGQVTGYNSTTTTATSQNPVVIHNTTPKEAISIASDTLENNSTPAAEKALMQTVYSMLFGGGRDWKFYWCATQCIRLELYEDEYTLEYCLGSVMADSIPYLSIAYMYTTYDSGDCSECNTEDWENLYGVATVITLDKNIGLEQDNNGVWNFVQ